MFGIALNIVDLLRHPRAVARELIDLRRSMARVPHDERLSQAEITLAREMLDLRLAMEIHLAGVQSCSTCARGCPPPRGIFDGGDCCSSPTYKLFSPEEVVALWATGTRPRHLRSRATVPAGCIFRGPLGCSLPARHRPNACTGYICPELGRELHARGDLDHAEALSGELKAGMITFEILRRERLLEALLRGKK